MCERGWTWVGSLHASSCVESKGWMPSHITQKLFTQKLRKGKEEKGTVRSSDFSRMPPKSTNFSWKSRRCFSVLKISRDLNACTCVAKFHVPVVSCCGCRFANGMVVGIFGTGGFELLLVRSIVCLRPAGFCRSCCRLSMVIERPTAEMWRCASINICFQIFGSGRALGEWANTHHTGNAHQHG